MRAESTPEKNIAPEVIVGNTSWRVSSIRLCGGYKFEVIFNDGLSGIVDMSELIMGNHSGVFGKLQNEALFKCVFLHYGAVTWPGDIDLAPDRMYEEISRFGKWVLK